MKIINIPQNTPEWLKLRIGKITGTKSYALSLKHYSTVDPDDLKQKIDILKGRADLYKIRAKEYADKTDNVDKKQVLADKWEAKANLAKTVEKADEYQQKVDDYRKQALEESQKNADKADEFMVKASATKKQIADTEKAYESALIESKRYKVPQEYWQFQAERYAEPAGDENPMERGHRLENENAELVVKKEKLKNPLYDTCFWNSSEFDEIGESPDVTEDSDKPTWAIECKSLGSPNHLKNVIPVLTHRALMKGEKSKNYHRILDNAYHVMPPITWDRDARDFDFIADDKYKAQVLQYFVANENLKVVYFSFYDPRILRMDAQHVYLTITRESVKDDIEDHLQGQLVTLNSTDANAFVMGKVAF